MLRRFIKRIIPLHSVLSILVDESHIHYSHWLYIVLRLMYFKSYDKIYEPIRMVIEVYRKRSHAQKLHCSRNGLRMHELLS